MGNIRGINWTTAKMKAAALWNTLAAIQIFIGIVLVALEDGAVGAEEVAPIVTGLLTMAVTVYRVWKVPNTQKSVGA